MRREAPHTAGHARVLVDLQVVLSEEGGGGEEAGPLRPLSTEKVRRLTDVVLPNAGVSRSRGRLAPFREWTLNIIAREDAAARGTARRVARNRVGTNTGAFAQRTSLGPP